jgi:hypothetical protein
MKHPISFAAAALGATLLATAPALAFGHGGGGFGGGFHGGGFHGGGFHGGGFRGGHFAGGRGFGWGAGFAGAALGLGLAAPYWGYDAYYPYGTGCYPGNPYYGNCGYGYGYGYPAY